MSNVPQHNDTISRSYMPQEARHPECLKQSFESCVEGDRGDCGLEHSVRVRCRAMANVLEGRRAEFYRIAQKHVSRLSSVSVVGMNFNNSTRSSSKFPSRM